MASDGEVHAETSKMKILGMEGSGIVMLHTIHSGE
jgi:hypothetical protein